MMDHRWQGDPPRRRWWPSSQFGSAPRSPAPTIPGYHPPDRGGVRRRHRERGRRRAGGRGRHRPMPSIRADGDFHKPGRTRIQAWDRRLQEAIRPRSGEPAETDFGRWPLSQHRFFDVASRWVGSVQRSTTDGAQAATWRVRNPRRLRRRRISRSQQSRSEQQPGPGRTMQQVRVPATRSPAATKARAIDRHQCSPTRLTGRPGRP